MSVEVESKAGMQKKRTEIINSAFERKGGKLIPADGSAPVYGEVLASCLSFVQLLMYVVIGDMSGEPLKLRFKH